MSEITKPIMLDETGKEIIEALNRISRHAETADMASDSEKLGGKEPIEYLGTGDVHEWAKQPNKPTYTASEVGALPSDGKAVDSDKLNGHPASYFATTATVTALADDVGNEIGTIKGDLVNLIPKTIEKYNLANKFVLGTNSSGLSVANGYASATKDKDGDDFPVKIVNDNFDNLYIENATNVNRVFFYADDIWGSGFISDAWLATYPVKLDIPSGTKVIGFYSGASAGSTVSINANVLYENSNECKIEKVAYFRGILTKDDNWDDFTENGIYAVASLPDNIASEFGIHNHSNCGRLTVQNGVATQSEAITQIYTDGLGYSQLYRLCSKTDEGYIYDKWVLMFDSKNTNTDDFNRSTVYYALGDSITSGSYSTSDGEGHAVNDAEWSYGKQIANSVGCEFHNLAYPGHSLVVGIKGQSLNVGGDATLVTVSGGANDYFLENNPLGKINDSEDAGTVYGALKAIVHNIARLAPHARIVLISPLIIKCGDASQNTKWSREYRYSNFTYDELNQAYKEVANLYNVEYIDGTTTGTTNIFNLESVQFDGIHPSKEYYSIIAKWLKAKLF